MPKITFTKMHGLGNDFIVLDGRKDGGVDLRGWELSESRAKRLCDRRFGVGADQILLLTESKFKDAHVKMEIWNADGSQAEMCGNGIRAVALYLNSRALLRSSKLVIETAVGPLPVEITGQVSSREVKVQMGVPKITPGMQSLELAGEGKIEFMEVDVGNPHAVLFLDERATQGKDVSDAWIEKVGPLLEHHKRFPRRTNVEFVKVRGAGAVDLRVWERGAGFTMACGTGACATAAALFERLRQGTWTEKKLAPKEPPRGIKVHLPGGPLLIEWPLPTQPLLMTGPATEVYSGTFDSSAF